ncbi:MAG: hypothetical protein LBE97_00340 [Holosporales bacterium]|jgi:hypothetical protein|nr:hypothetical protein [Holosporales bacterium]
MPLDPRNQQSTQGGLWPQQPGTYGQQQEIQDMTLQDVDDGMRYDVARKEFMKIARISNKPISNAEKDRLLSLLKEP